MGTGAEAPAEAEALELLPVGTLPHGILLDLAARLSRHVELPCRPLPPSLDLRLPRLAGRDQLDAGALLAALEARAAPERLLVGVTAEDVAVPVFTFVFGLARQGGRAALVSLARADPVFYGLPPDPDLTAGRAVAEILHELGHLASLEHCADRSCLMSFAGNLERVDVRGRRFCPGCSARLPAWLRGPAPLPETV
jgi:archaemetzincin